MSDPKEKPYQKREIDHYFEDIFKRLDKQDTSLSAILIQTTAHNGRMAKLEWWRSAVIWGLGALWTVMLIIIPFLWSYMKVQIQIASRQSVNDILNKYGFEIIDDNN